MGRTQMELVIKEYFDAVNTGDLEKMVWNR